MATRRAACFSVLLITSLAHAQATLHGLGSTDLIGSMHNSWNRPRDVSGLKFTAEGASLNDSVIVGRVTSDAWRATPYEWSGNAMHELPILAGGQSGGATGISWDGSVIAGWSTTGAGVRAVIWTNGQPRPLGSLPASSYNLADGVSADGRVVVGVSGYPSSFSSAFRWMQSDGMEELRGPAGYSSTFARSVSGDGSMIVGAGIIGARRDSRALMWLDGRPREMSDVLSSLGADLRGWMLTSADFVSSDGRTLAGLGLHNGVAEGWTATVPSAGGVGLLALAGLAVARRSRATAR